jgi:excisionase family DNA binding protein
MNLRDQEATEMKNNEQAPIAEPQGDRPRLMTPAEVSRVLGCTLRRVYRLTSKGVLPAVRIGRTIKFDRITLEKWIATGGGTYMPP